MRGSALKRWLSISRNSDRLFAALLVIAAFLAYQPAWNGGPLWDDNAHLTRPCLQHADGLSLIWTKLGYTQQYYPLTHTVFWLAHGLWGDHSAGYHLLNICLHVFSALLLLKILRSVKIPGARLAAALFCLHPVQVESVAWMSELKNTLSGVFFFGSALAHLHFDRKRKANWYWLAFALFLAGLLSKTAISTMPVVLLAVFWWKRGAIRWKQDVVPLLIFIVAGITLGLFTGWVERRFIIGPTIASYDLSLVERCLVAGRAFWFYLVKLAWPAHLTFMYPRWTIQAGAVWQYLFPIATAVLGAILWLLRGRSRAPFAAAVCFTALLFPALGFVNIYPFRFSFVADHFQYLSCAAPLVLLAAGAASLWGKTADRRLWFGFATVLPAALTVLTFIQSGTYRDIETLYQKTIAANPDCWLAYSNLGSLRAQQGDNRAAADYFRKALRCNPGCLDAMTGLGDAGFIPEAFTHLRAHIENHPDDVLALDDLGVLLLQTGKTGEALDVLRKACALDSLCDQAQANYGNALLQAGRPEEARAHLTAALAINPLLKEACNSLGVLYLESGQANEAIDCFAKGVRIAPADYDSHANLGRALMLSGRAAEAAAQFSEALKIDPTSAEACDNYAEALLRLGRPAEAVGFFRQAVDKSPGSLKFLHDLSAACLQTGQLTEALQAMHKASAVARSAGQDAVARQIELNAEELATANK